MNMNPGTSNDSLAEQIEQQLSAVLYRFSCPDTEELLNFRWGFLSSEQTQAITEHLQHCPHCSQEIAGFSGPTVSTPTAKTNNVTYPRLIARWLPASAPVRMAERGKRDVYVQYYQVEELEWDITLNWITEPGMTFSLQGQLFGSTPDEMGQVEIFLTSLPSVLADAKGTFVFSAVPPGQYELRMLSSQGEIIIPLIELQ